ncbi:MAG: hypothetical protein GC136_02710 [Alphaproteobacteria bacterium]|nr:hypothetical protein [Alphaproteobacteria bacterium]
MKSITKILATAALTTALAGTAAAQDADVSPVATDTETSFTVSFDDPNNLTSRWVQPSYLEEVSPIEIQPVDNSCAAATFTARDPGHTNTRIAQREAEEAGERDLDAVSEAAEDCAMSAVQSRFGWGGNDGTAEIGSGGQQSRGDFSISASRARYERELARVGGTEVTGMIGYEEDREGVIGIQVFRRN